MIRESISVGSESVVLVYLDMPDVILSLPSSLFSFLGVNRLHLGECHSHPIIAPATTETRTRAGQHHQLEPPTVSRAGWALGAAALATFDAFASLAARPWALGRTANRAP